MKLNIKSLLKIKHILMLTTILLCLSSCGRANSSEGEYKVIETLDLEYADQFSVDYYEGGYTHIHIEDNNDYIIIPEGKAETDLGFQGATMIHENPQNIYMAASSAMDLTRQLNALNKIKFCSTKEEDYTIPEIKEAINKGNIQYIGKYSAPDYEALINNDCDLAVESTMIYHSPQIKELLEREGIPVLVERSSYEESPLGRLEWIKLYGLLCDKEEAAKSYFNTQESKINAITQKHKGLINSKKVAFFYITTNDSANVRKPGDYISKMIEMAGGMYTFDDLKMDEENSLSTINIGFEDFYLQASEADILIYNSTTVGELSSLEDLIAKNGLFKDFKAVQQNQVYCTSANMFQETSRMGEVVEDFYTILNNTDEPLEYLYKVE